MINSCPRKASPTRAALELGATRMVSSCTSVPRWASAKAKVEVARRTAAAIAARPDCEFRNGNLSDWRVYPPPPRSIVIIELAPKRDLIYGLQQLTGKIFKTKEIRAEHCCFHSVVLDARLVPVVNWGQGELAELCSNVPFRVDIIAAFV